MDELQQTVDEAQDFEDWFNGAGQLEQDDVYDWLQMFGREEEGFTRETAQEYWNDAHYRGEM